MHWPVPLNPNGNDSKFPKKEDGSRDLVSYAFLTRAPIQLFIRYPLCRTRNGPSTKPGNRWRRSLRKGSSRRLAFPSLSFSSLERSLVRRHWSDACSLRGSFSEPMLDDLLKTAKVTPAANQVRGRFVRSDSGAGHMLRHPFFTGRIAPVPAATRAARVPRGEGHCGRGVLAARLDRLAAFEGRGHQKDCRQAWRQRRNYLD